LKTEKELAVQLTKEKLEKELAKAEAALS